MSLRETLWAHCDAAHDVSTTSFHDTCHKTSFVQDIVNFDALQQCIPSWAITTSTEQHPFCEAPQYAGGPQL
jgi:hypothetical protein